MDWTMMKAAMANVASRYPVDWNFANFAKMACWIGDIEEAARYYRQIVRDDGEAWGEKKDEWQSCRTMAQGYVANRKLIDGPSE